MSASLLVLLLCMALVEPRHLDRPGPQREQDEESLGPLERLHRAALRLSGARAAVGPLEETRGPGVRVSRGTKGSWRKRVHVTSDPDRYFTTTRIPLLNVSGGARVPLVNVSAGARTALLGGGALWGVLLLGLVLFSVGLVGNLAVTCLVSHSLRMQSSWHGVLAGLALWDLIVLFFCLPIVLLHQLTGTRLMLSCSLVPFLEVSSMGVATFSLCALSIDRFHSATSPAPPSVHVSAPVEPCATILSKLSVVFIGALLLAAPELLLYRRSALPLVEAGGHYSTQVDVCLAEPSPELPLAVLSLVLTYQEARSWWVFGCYLCLPLLFTLSCDLVTRRVTSQPAPQPIGRQEGGSCGSSPSVAKKELGSNRSPSPSVSRQEVCSRTSSLTRKLLEREAGQRSVILALIGLYSACTLPDAVCSVGVSYLPALPVGVAPALRLIGQFLLFLRCAATPLLSLYFSKALGGAFVHCCCCCCDECHAHSGPDTPPNTPDTPTVSLATPSTLLATPLPMATTPSTLIATPLSTVTTPSTLIATPTSTVALPSQQQAELGTPC